VNFAGVRKDRRQPAGRGVHGARPGLGGGAGIGSFGTAAGAVEENAGTLEKSAAVGKSDTRGTGRWRASLS
jgi:hypothetical protein